MTDESAKNEEQAQVEITDFLEGLYGDPLRAETMRTGRNLVIASAICIAVVLFNLRLTSSSLIPIEFGNRADVLPMLLSIAVLLLFASFLLRSLTDLLRDRETKLLVTRYIEDKRVGAALEEAREGDRYMAAAQQEDDGYDPDPDPWWQGYTKVAESASAAVKKAEEKVGIRRLPRTLRLVRCGLEVGVPLVFALVALVLSRASLASFAISLVSAFKP